MRSVIFTIPTIVSIVLLIFTSLGKRFIFSIARSFLLPDQTGNQGSFGVCLILGLIPTKSKHYFSQC